MDAAPSIDASDAASMDSSNGALLDVFDSAAPMDVSPDDTHTPRDVEIDVSLPESKRVLFVGNSYTYVNDLPQVVRDLAAASGVALDTEVIASGSAKLCDHFSSPETQERIASGDHDTVVIQGQSLVLFYDGESSFYCGEHLARSARDAGADIVWFATWARREGHEFYSRGRGATTPAEMAGLVEGFYKNLAMWGPGGHVARIAHAWEQAKAMDPSLELYDEDGSHPSPEGTFVAACTLAQAILGRTPEIPSPPPLGLDAQLAQTLCDVATQEPCFDNLHFCGECLSVAFDPMHCGDCETTCGESQECWQSTCQCRAGFSVPTTFENLALLDPTCQPGSSRPGFECDVAAHRACMDQPCASSGFGPVTNEAGDPQLICTGADVVAATYSELAAYQPQCDGVSERRGDACRNAAHKACIARGASAGFGPVSQLDDGNVEIACLNQAEILLIPNAAIDAWGCEGFPDRVWDETCDQTAHRMCISGGYFGGYGPVEAPPERTDFVGIVCISR